MQIKIIFTNSYNNLLIKNYVSLLLTLRKTKKLLQEKLFFTTQNKILMAMKMLFMVQNFKILSQLQNTVLKKLVMLLMDFK